VRAVVHLDSQAVHQFADASIGIRETYSFGAEIVNVQFQLSPLGCANAYDGMTSRRPVPKFASAKAASGITRGRSCCSSADGTQRPAATSEDLHSALERVRQAACRDKEMKFTSL
jgi:hypothetical protein